MTEPLVILIIVVPICSLIFFQVLALVFALLKKRKYLKQKEEVIVEEVDLDE